MLRKDFLKSLSILPLAGYSMKLNFLDHLMGAPPSSDLMPVIFAGHGSPMNALDENEFSMKWKEIGTKIPKPKAIVCISAHWETRGSRITAMQNPRTIHDFGGFPPALYKVEYPAPGDPGLANDTSSLYADRQLLTDEQWGLDHGTWSILVHMFPEANIPVLQISLDSLKSPQQHLEFAGTLSALRKRGVLILGSGNLVHNLGLLDWNRPEGGSDWALEANEIFRKLILDGDSRRLAEYRTLGQAVQLAVPTPEHFLPMLYVLEQKDERDEIALFNDKAVMGSLTMTSFILQNAQG